MANRKPLNLKQLVRVPTVSGYDVSPDGRTAAVAWDKTGPTQIYLAPVNGKGQPRAITKNAEHKTAPRFSPSGAHLLFAQDYGGDEKFDLFLYDLRTRRTRNLTPDTPETINPETSWSPDGQWIAYTSDKAGRFATYIQNVETGETRRLTQHEYTDYIAEWSPDGKHVAVVANTHGQTYWIFVVPVQTSEPPRAISNAAGPVDGIQPRWSPDGQRLAFISNAQGMAGVYTYRLRSGQLRRETPPTHEASAPDWSPDGQQLAYLWNDDGDERVAVKDLRTRAVRFVSFAEGVHMTPRFNRAGGKLFCLYNGPRHPVDLWAVTLTHGRKRQLTRSLPATFRPQDFISPRVVRWPSDEYTIAGRLFLPRDYRLGQRRAAVLYVHGGPTWQFKNEWYILPQALASAGLVVLAVNYRGSTGYGKAFQEANRFDLGGGDMRDVIAGAQWLIDEGYADPKRLGLTGMSYGGYLTMTALAKHPRVFAAGSAVVPFLNWFTEHANERADLQYWDLENFGDPVKDADRYREYSPIYFVPDITGAVQMLAGENDPRCPANETEQAAEALKALGVPHEVVIYPDEGHSFHHRHTRLDAFTRRFDFLKAHLQ